MQKLSLFAAGLLLIGMSGCATIIRGTEQKLKFETEPSGATVTVGDKQYTTPVTLSLKRRREYTVLVNKEGYVPIQFVLKGTWDGASLSSAALPGGSLMVATDRAGGADLAFYPLPKIQLQPAKEPTTRPIELYQWKKELLSKEAYEKAKEEERMPYIK